MKKKNIELIYDDNHINAILRSSVEEGKNVTVLFFDNKSAVADPDSVIRKRLRLDGKRSNLHVITINSTDCYSVFNDQLK